MQLCPLCNKVYDEIEYSSCPYCSGEIEESGETPFKNCPKCDGVMYWNNGWECSNCGFEIDSDEDDCDGVIVK